MLSAAAKEIGKVAGQRVAIQAGSVRPRSGVLIFCITGLVYVLVC